MSIRQATLTYPATAGVLVEAEADPLPAAEGFGIPAPVSALW